MFSNDAASSSAVDWERLRALGRLALETALAMQDAHLELAPDALEPRFDRACILAALGRADEARAAYWEVVVRRPEHLGALSNLASLLRAVGFHRSARALYARAARHHPASAEAHVNLAHALVELGELDAAREHYERALALDPQTADAHHGMARIHELRGDEFSAEERRKVAYRLRPITIMRYRGDAPPVRMLILGTAGDGNVALHQFLDEQKILGYGLVCEYYDPAFPLPEHHVVFNSIGDADRAAYALQVAHAIVARTDKPIINHPQAVSASGRIANAQRLRAIEGVVTARTVKLERAALAESAGLELAKHGFTFPALLRSPGYHTGMHFVKVERAADVPQALAQLPGDELLVIEYLDAANHAGTFRKYRVMIVDGHLYPLHLAIATDWKVHYFSADMAQTPEHRREDERFLADMRGVLGVRAFNAVKAIGDVLGLDYAGVDFGLDSHGNVLLFEANATMIVPEPDLDPRWDYRRRPVAEILAAVRGMLLARASAGGYEAAQATPLFVGI